jgi:hypothetical protein
MFLIFAGFLAWKFRAPLEVWTKVYYARFKNRNTEQKESKEDTGEIFKPVGIIRYFDMTLEITEMGDQNTKIEVVKKKRKE